MSLSAFDQKEIAAMPALLRALLDAELAAGNAIAEVGHSFPAPPVGAYFKLTQPLLSREQKSGEGLEYQDRDNSTYSGEITDAKRFYFLLEPARPPKPQPSMDATRAAHAPAKWLPAMSATRLDDEYTNYTVEVDCRGESLMYREADRSASVICTFGRGPLILPRTLSNWSYALGCSEKMSAEEKLVIIARIAAYCRKHHRMANLTFET